MIRKIQCFVLLLLILSSNICGIPKPKILNPLENSVVSVLDPIFSLKYNSGPGTSYEFRIAEDPALTQNLLVLRTNQPNLWLVLPFLKEGSSYYWTVRALRNQGGTTEQSDWVYANNKSKTYYKFSVSQDAGGGFGYQPVPKKPVYNETISTLKPELTWEFPDYKEATFEILNTSNEWVLPQLKDIVYQLQISTSKDFVNNCKTFEIENINTFSLAIPYLRKGVSYFWRVKAKYLDPQNNKLKESGWSYPSSTKNGISSFKVSDNAEGKFGFSEGMKEEIFDPFKLASVEKITNGNYNFFAPAVSHDGTKLAFCSDRDGQIEIYVKNLEERVGGGETRKTISSKGISNFNPFWLLNNIETGFYSNRYNVESIWELFSTAKGTGTSVTFQTNRMEMEENPSDFNLFGTCSGDGKIVFTGKFRNNNIYRLFLKDLQDNSFTELRPGMFPCINNFDKIVFAADEKGDGNYEIMVVELEGHSINNPSVLAPDESSDYDPAFSPDGLRIAFTSTRSGNSDLWIMNFDGTEIRQITFHPMVDRRPQWVDNETLVFQSNRPGINDNKTLWNIYKVKVPK